jgi:hypothetical protein
MGVEPDHYLAERTPSKRIPAHHGIRRTASHPIQPHSVMAPDTFTPNNPCAFVQHRLFCSGSERRVPNPVARLGQPQFRSKR